jgi:uncharacterized membrane protein
MPRLDSRMLIAVLARRPPAFTPSRRLARPTKARLVIDNLARSGEYAARPASDASSYSALPQARRRHQVDRSDHPHRRQSAPGLAAALVIFVLSGLVFAVGDRSSGISITAAILTAVGYGLFALASSVLLRYTPRRAARNILLWTILVLLVVALASVVILTLAGDANPQPEPPPSPSTPAP